jgi:hypothetical protein
MFDKIPVPQKARELKVIVGFKLDWIDRIMIFNYRILHDVTYLL